MMSAQAGELDFFRPSSHQRRQVMYLVIGLAALLLLALTVFRSTVFSQGYMPHAFCYLRRPTLIWSNVVADSLIGLSYTAISISLALLVVKGRKQIPFRWMFLAFGLFIVACGGTHFVETITIWIPIYVFAAALKVFTAIASVSTAVALPFSIPRVLGLIREARASQQHQHELQATLEQLSSAQAALQDTNRYLEQQVAARTRELTRTNEKLRSELLQRQTLQLAHSRLAAIVQSSDDAIIGKDLDGVITDWNHGAEKLYGYKAGEAIGQKIDIIVPPDRRSEISEILGSVANGTAVEHLETQRVTSGGAVLDVSITASPVLDAEGKLLGVSVIARDITMAKRTEDALRESEAKYRLLFEKNPMPMWIFDQQTLRFQSVNEAAVRHYGYSREEFLRMTIADIRPQDELPKLLDIVPHRVRGLQDAGIWRHRKKDGTVIEVEVTTCELDVPSPDSLLVLAHDVTERVTNQRRLWQSEERFSKIFRSSPLGITISTESTGRYIDANPAFLKMIGYDHCDLIGKTAKELNIWYNPKERELLLGALTNQESITPLQVQFKTRSGDVRLVEIASERIELEDQNCILAISHDVTEARRLEDQLRQAQKMEAIGRLAGGVAHDFNNMLGVIVGYSDLSRERVVDDKIIRNHLAQIRRAAERAAALTRQLLAFSRQQHQVPRVLSLNDIVLNLKGMLSRMIGEDVSLVFRPTNPLGSVKVDLVHMEQVLMNLAVNARDAMPKGGELIIETQNILLDSPYLGPQGEINPGRYVLLTVSDTGCGMDSATLAQAFEPFFTTKEMGKGTGLGLSTVWGIVKQSNGYISAYSELGRGATFKIYLPSIDHPAESLIPAVIDAIPPAGKETVLVVEDEDAMRELVVSLLERRGYRVLSASSGQIALDFAKAFEGEIALVITDVIMPGMTGPDLVSELKKQRGLLKVLYMSGYARSLVVDEGLIKPESLMLSKPFSSLELLTKVRDALRS